MVQIRLRDLWLWWPGQKEPVLRGVHLDLQGPGLTVVSGAAGSGKSTLLRLLAGLIPRAQAARIQGEMHLTTPGDRPPALLLQHPETQLAAFMWAQEVQGRAAPPVPLRRLSRGELQRLALHHVLSTSASLVLLDEPFANLDPQAEAQLVAWIQEHRARRRILLVTHTLPRGCVPDEALRMHQGVLEPVPLQVLLAQRQLRIPPEAFPGPRAVRPLASPRLQLSGVRLWRHGRILLQDGHLHLAPGDLALLTGPNGSGKTTLIRWMVGLEPKAGTGTLHWAGRPVATLRGRALLVPQRPERLFWGGTVGETLRRLGGQEGFLEPPLPQALWHRPAVLLSGGEAQIGALAVALALRPAVLLLDEPTHALDAENLERLRQWLHNYRHQGGLGIVVTHHPHLFADVATQWYHLEDARLETRPA